jgi:transcriptional regulator with XRE-family HTH domain
VYPLNRSRLSDSLSAVDFSQRVRDRLRDEKAARKLSEREIADLLQWTQSRVAQKLSGRTPITLNELEALCFALSLSPSEAVRDRGLEFCAEMTPTELRLLERLRKLEPATRDAILLLLDVKQKHHLPERFAKPLRSPAVKSR